MGAAKRLGKRLVTDTSGSRDTPDKSWHSSGVGDGMVAMGAAIMGDGRGAAGMSSRVTWSPRSCPRCW